MRLAAPTNAACYVQGCGVEGVAGGPSEQHYLTTIVYTALLLSARALLSGPALQTARAST